jgi:hypothetical protein
LSDGISSGGFGPAVITWSDLQSWKLAMGIELAPWESRALVQLGSLRAAIAAEANPPARPAAS